jgi:hypothetical protein
MTEPKTFGNLVGFTPLFDEVIEAFKNDSRMRDGVSPIAVGLVFGRVWRRCQGDEGICYESARSMAKELGLARSTVVVCLNRLVDAGYIYKGGLKIHPKHKQKTRVYSLDEKGIRLSDTLDGEGIRSPDILNKKGIRSSDMQGIRSSDTKIDNKERYILRKSNNNISLLLELGVTETKANEIAQLFSEETITEKIKVYRWGLRSGKPWKPGYLIDMIEKGYSPPHGYKPDPDSPKQRRKYLKWQEMENRNKED